MSKCVASGRRGGQNAGMGQEHDDYGEAGSRPGCSWLRRMAVGLVLVLLAYIVSYAVLLDPGEIASGGLWRMNVCRVPAYRAGGEFAGTAFRPALWVDRHIIRPSYWDWREEVYKPPLQEVDLGIFRPAGIDP
jgi:hypothetical protein